MFNSEFHSANELLSPTGEAQGVCKVRKPAAWAAPEQEALFPFCIFLNKVHEAGAAAAVAAASLPSRSHFSR